MNHPLSFLFPALSSFTFCRRGRAWSRGGADTTVLKCLRSKVIISFLHTWIQFCSSVISGLLMSQTTAVHICSSRVNRVSNGSRAVAAVLWRPKASLCSPCQYADLRKASFRARGWEDGVDVTGPQSGRAGSLWNLYVHALSTWWNCSPSDIVRLGLEDPVCHLKSQTCLFLE